MGQAAKRYKDFLARLQAVDGMTFAQASSWIAEHDPELREDYVDEANEE
jgi:hypothetical protein